MEALLVNGLLAFTAGILLNFTPCVLPVIPLKIRAVLQEIEGATRPRILAAGALLLGSLTFFVLLGGATAYLGWKWGEIFQSRIFVTLLAIFLLVSGIAMLAGWSLRLPQAVYKIPIHRYMGAFLTGVLAGILSTPCSGPFLGAVLAYAVTQSSAVTIVLFTAIGFGLAFPYSGILLFPHVLKYLPRGGRIGTQVESLLAFILIAGAIFFGQAMLPTSFSTPLWGIFLLGLVVWGILEFTKGEKKSERLVPACLTLILIFASFSLLKNSSGSGLDWKPYAQSNLDEALQSGRPVLLEFTADWCINCKILEKTTYSSLEVIATAKKMNLVALQVDMTKFRDAEKTLLDHYGGTALPYAVLLEPSGHAMQTFSGMFSAETMVKGILDMEKKQ